MLTILQSNSRVKYLVFPCIALIALALIALSTKLFRGATIDLTQNRVHSLSPGTEKLIAGINQSIELRLYYSDSASAELPQFRVYAQRVIALLKQMEARSKGKIKLTVIDPVAFSAEEDEALSYGIQALPMSDGENNFYFGLIAKRNVKTGASVNERILQLPFIDPNKAAFFEYELAKLIVTLNTDKPPALAIISGLLTGPSINAVTGQPSLGWVIDRKLSERYEIRRLAAETNAIDDDVNVLMIIHPKNLPEPTLFAIDQFVLRGGRVLIFVDPNAESDTDNAVLNRGLESSSSSDVKPLFQAWGLEYNPSRTVLDSQNAMQVGSTSQQAQYHLEVLGLPSVYLNQNNLMSAQLEKLNVSSAGSLGLSEGSALSLEVLVQSSSVAMLEDTQTVRLAELSPEILRKTFKPTGESYIIAAHFSGILKSAFAAKSAPKQLMQSTKPAQIVVVADTDILTDRLWVQEQNFLGAVSYTDFANNGEFIMNIVDHFAGDDNLISLRTRGVAARPFERIEKIQRSAVLRYQDAQRELQVKLERLDNELRALQAAENKPASDKTQQQAIQRIQKDKAAIRLQLRNVQHQLNKDIDEIITEVKLINILLVPGFVALVAFLYAWRRSYKRRSFLRR
jgi:ABC-type uncharacterized transport system involved in gliding motility auxiliary subunit